MHMEATIAQLTGIALLLVAGLVMAVHLTRLRHAQTMNKPPVAVPQEPPKPKVAPARPVPLQRHSWDLAMRPSPGTECRHPDREAVCRHLRGMHTMIPILDYRPSDMQPWVSLRNRIQELETRTGQRIQWPTMQVQNRDPGIVRLRHAIPPSLANAVLSRSAGHFARSLTIQHSSGKNITTKDRTSETYFMQRLDPNDTDMVTL